MCDAALRAVTMDDTERRLLGLRNPGCGPTPIAFATPTINATLQVLRPGEQAPAHRHSLSALRFVMDGNGATTIVEGKACAMNEGDLIITPAWTWHEHAHDGAKRIVWFNSLDVGLQLFLGINEFEPGPAKDVPARMPDAAFALPGYVPKGGDQGTPYSPVFRYGWDSVVAALQATPADADGSRTLRYVNPVTGGPVMPLLDCYLLGLEEGRETRPYRTTSNAVCVVAEGSGRSVVGGETLEWERNDVISLPHGNWINHRAASATAKLFIVSDREILRRLDLLRDEVGN
jgi:gentisate 1,2-dioxygenase